eukprot:scaffold2.g6868.t1
MADLAALIGQLHLEEPAAAEAIVIGDKSFASESAAWKHSDAVKHRLLGRRIEPGDQDFEFLEGLLERHPRGPAKVQHPPVKAFVAQRKERGSGIEFRFMDSAGERHDFSCKKCMERRDKPLEKKRLRAMELAVRDQTQAFQAEQEEPACALCGAADCALYADHNQPSLPELCRQFIQATPDLPPPSDFCEAPLGGAQLRRSKPVMICSGKRDALHAPKDVPFADAWAGYHADHASMRLLCTRCLKAEDRRRGVRRLGEDAGGCAGGVAVAGAGVAAGEPAGAEPW